MAGAACLNAHIGRGKIFLGGVCLVGALAAVSAVGLTSRQQQRDPGNDLSEQASQALSQKDYALAEELASRIPRDDPSWSNGQLIAGEAAAHSGRPQSAIAYYGSIPRDESPEAVLAAFSLAEVHRELGQLSQAEHCYREVLAIQPQNGVAHERMAFLLGITGRHWESRPHYLNLIRSRNWTLEYLVLLGDLERPLEQGQYLRRSAENSPDDDLVQVGLAANEFSEKSSTEARRRLENVLSHAPELIAAQAMLGELLVCEDDETFAEWHAGLPPAANESADIWYVRGLRARRQEELEIAARCFWETVRLAPTHRRGNYALGQVLTSLGETSGTEFTLRAGLLSELTRLLDDVMRSQGRHEKTVKRVFEIMESCGRLWEAWAWGVTASQFFPYSDWPKQAVSQLTPHLRADLPQVIESKNLALKHDFSHFPDCKGLFTPDAQDKLPDVSNLTQSRIRFEESASIRGIEFVYNNGPDPATPGARMFEQTAGGVGVLDFDGDRLPDLYFTQGAEWRTGSDEPTLSPTIIDCLYRNQEGAGFVDATRGSHLADTGFSQGCAIGDINNDGFPDLYVANIGRNRLYVNNGDGTFTDVTEDCGLTGNDWTASCVIVDLNADGLPDLFDANYVSGPNVYELICDGEACSPKNFPGTRPRLHLNQGNGAFALSEATPPGKAKGLGVVAFDLSTRGRPSLFIANDQVPNFFLRNSPSHDESNVHLEEEAFLSGLAFNQDGLSMAGMGIAADDVDGNALIDFFVTNFKDESNTLYLQDSPGLFVDMTKSADLSAPSWPFVGWGTQFLDADLDGYPDLALTNGHVDDYRGKGGEYHMRPQFFRNLGEGKFSELTAETVGPYFGQKFLGRGMSRLDWNQDGRMDFVVSNIGQQASLVTNQSRDVGHFLNVRLSATTTSRDAIGTVVEVVTDGGRWTKQLVAGDGYMASNERVLQFGIGAASSIQEVRIHWPSGNDLTLKDVPLDTTIMAVEGQDQWY